MTGGKYEKLWSQLLILTYWNVNVCTPTYSDWGEEF